MSDTLIAKFSLDDLIRILQQAGYRVETVTGSEPGAAHLRSATGGVMFEIRPGNRLADSGDFVDAMIVAAVKMEGNLPLEMVNRWNATRRFARLQFGESFLMLTQDISVIGGVSADHLRGQIEIWDHLVQQLIGYLREELPKLTQAPSLQTVVS